VVEVRGRYSNMGYVVSKELQVTYRFTRLTAKLEPRVNQNLHWCLGKNPKIYWVASIHYRYVILGLNQGMQVYVAPI
jgi:hypothetical protein